MTFLEILIFIIVGAVAIRFSFKFDLNKFLENRRKIKLDRLKNICPHIRIIDITGNQIGVESLFSSPTGTSRWICSQCGCVVDHKDDVERISDRYSKDPSIILNRQKRFNKEAKKLKLV
jgi:hypothetical protein